MGGEVPHTKSISLTCIPAKKDESIKLKSGE
jgi:hypothetical protein